MRDEPARHLRKITAMKAKSFSFSLLLGLVSTTAWLALSLGAVSLASSGCGDSAEEKTAGKRVTLRTRVESADDLSKPTLNARGWSVTWSRVLVSVSSLYYYDGAPPSLARLPSPSLWQRWFGISVAHAHPGHYQAGNAMGQMLTAASFDLVSGPTDLAEGEGVTGPYRSASLLFGSPAQGQMAAVLGSNVILVEGTATREQEIRVFRARATAADVTNASGTVGVDGCVFDEATINDNGTVVVRFSPSVWIDQVDFTDVPASSDTPVEFPAGSAAQQAFTLLGVTRASAYSFAFEP
ncbi:MAG: hypothetical protein BWY17_04177 [Deltaproteobacteria bacterium ADurb.Bin207]|nr:MAG: hypothetical protein BWY17_04177 [Deltaproteobacteria bacterium ADurb.Bin207]